MKAIKKPKFIEVPFIGELALSGVRPILGIALGLLAGGVLIAVSGVNPFKAYKAMLQGAFGNRYAFSNVLVRSSPLLLGGIGVSLGIKAGVWNTGIEGYMYLGAVGAAVVGIPALGLPPVAHIILTLIVAMAFGAAWGLIPGYLRAYKGVNEVTSTIMLNYVAVFLTSWLVAEPQPLAEIGSFYPMSKLFQESAQLPILVRGTSLHPGAFIGLAVCVLLYFVLRYTPFGFRTRMLGFNPNAARYAGVNTRKQIMLLIIIGAMLGGLAGAIEVTGLKRRVYMNFVTGVGYESVAVALLAGGNPLGVIAAALFFSALKAGGATMSIQTNIGAPMTSVIIALCVIFVIGVGVSERRRLGKVQDNEKSEAVNEPKIKEEENVT
ncbi:MAG: ABC transporter permease [Synergistaceae bacterium]|jgi:simple sugar transport system permease protein|nr:ABC transporter permease [Synergistaceae bacterium]